MSNQNTLTELSEYPVVTTWPIQWGDQDAFGHVNNTVPIRWFESSRLAYLEKTPLHAHAVSGGLGPILAAIHCNYRSQLTYPDTIHVGARIAAIGRTSFKMEHAVYSEAGRSIAAEGDSVVVVFNYETQKPTRVPDEVRAAIEAIEGRSLSS
ncbi:MAG: thioesterase family protein [Pirellulales bacterium]